jgi:hypothetical protein
VNLKKGLLRLTIVVSIIAGIITPFTEFNFIGWNLRILDYILPRGGGYLLLSLNQNKWVWYGFLAFLGIAYVWLAHVFIRWVAIYFVCGKVISWVIAGFSKETKTVKFSEKCIVFAKHWWGLGAILFTVFSVSYYILACFLIIWRWMR